MLFVPRLNIRSGSLKNTITASPVLVCPRDRTESQSLHPFGLRDPYMAYNSTHENIVVTHAPSDDAWHESVSAAIKCAFASARRQIDDLQQSS